VNFRGNVGIGGGKGREFREQPTTPRRFPQKEIKAIEAPSPLQPQPNSHDRYSMETLLNGYKFTHQQAEPWFNKKTPTTIEYKRPLTPQRHEGKFSPTLCSQRSVLTKRGKQTKESTSRGVVKCSGRLFLESL